jgi:CheY-like chemotaxis protein
MEEATIPLSILIAEDEDASREILVNLLSLKYPHAVIHSVSDGRSGLECFAKHRPRLVIADVSMPEVDGIKMSATIRSMDSATRFIMLTAHDLKGVSQRFLELGMENFRYIPKPVLYSELFAAIDQSIAELG